HAALHRQHAEQQGARGEDRVQEARRRVHARVLHRSRRGRVGAERPIVHVPPLRRHDRQRLHPDDALPVPIAGPAAQSGRQPVLLRELQQDRQRPRGRRRVAVLQGLEPRAPGAGQADRVPDLPEPVPGERRGDEANRALREIPRARVSRQARSRPAPRDYPDAAVNGRGILRIAVAAALTAYLLWRSDPAAVADAARHADGSWIVAAVLLVLVDRALMAWRWAMLLCIVDERRRPALGRMLEVFFVSTFVGTFLPASIGSDAVRAYSISRDGVSGADAVASVFMD